MTWNFLRVILKNSTKMKAFVEVKAVNTASYLVNHCPSTSMELKTIDDVWFGSPANYYNLKIFGCPTYFHVIKDKFEPRAKKSIFIRYVVLILNYPQS